MSCAHGGLYAEGYMGGLAEAARIAKAERDGFEAALDLGNSVRGAEIVLRTIQQRISELEGKGGER